MSGNGFTREQQAFIREVAFAVLKEGLEPALALHAAECPHGKAVTKWKYILLGILLCLGVLGVGGGVSAASVLLKVFGG